MMISEIKVPLAFKQDICMCPPKRNLIQIEVVSKWLLNVQINIDLYLLLLFWIL